MTATEQQAITDIATLVEEKASDRINDWIINPHLEFCNALRQLAHKMYAVDPYDSTTRREDMTFEVYLESSHDQFTTDYEAYMNDSETVYSYTGWDSHVKNRDHTNVSELGSGMYITIVVTRPSEAFENLARNNSLVQSNFKGLMTANVLGFNMDNEKQRSLALTWPQFLDITREYHTQLALEKIACGSLPVDSKEMPF